MPRLVPFMEIAEMEPPPRNTKTLFTYEFVQFQVAAPPVGERVATARRLLCHDAYPMSLRIIPLTCSAAWGLVVRIPADTVVP